MVGGSLHGAHSGWPEAEIHLREDRQEVAEELSKALSDRASGFVFDADTLTLGGYLDRWLSHSVRGSVRQRTFERYEQIARVHIKPTLGRIKLKALTPTHVRGLYREKLDDGLAPRTVQYIHTTLRKALKEAVQDGLIPRNAADAVKAPRPAKKEINLLAPEQARIFLEVASRDRFEALYVLAIHCGLREGELLGLKWDDLDLEVGTLSVCRTLSETKEVGRMFEPPKNSNGRSTKLTPGGIEALRDHLARQLEEIKRAGDRYKDQGLVFPSQTGTPMNAKNLTARSFKPLLAEAGLPRSVRLHDLRHTCATLLLGKGVHPKIVQELLGHATIAITLDTYSHVLPNMQSEAVKAIEEVLT
jgi:integrase